MLVREFANYWKRRVSPLSPRKSDAVADTPAGSSSLLSKKKIETKLTEIALYGRCTTEGPLLGRCCWLVKPDVLAALPTELPLPSEWKWTTKTCAKRAATAAAADAPTAAERPRPGVALITKFAKVVTPEEARRELLSPPAKRKIMPTKLSAPDSPATPPAGRPAQHGISKFFKASPVAAAGPSGTPGRSGAAPVLPAPAPGTSSAASATGSDAGTPKRRLAPTPVGSSAA
ncbi:translation initiation factor IF-2-like [Pollicipes pollicipes]|uniref:translation initiation factor IF-2-like n=1 Tax=Pollicipes pollicipes TaxID=41117 RepID=UPI0018854F6D|nr:translation initiation factor IF-2-like [Pollicipes pollicipes]